MAAVPNLTFQSVVRTLETKPDRVAVTFKTEAAYYWVATEHTEIVRALESARQSGARIEATWNPITMQIVAVK